MRHRRNKKRPPADGRPAQGGGAESGIVAPWNGKWSRPISRVLSRTVIHLGRPSPNASSDLPGDTCGPQAARGAPPYLVLLQRGFAVPSTLPRTRCALTAPFHPYLAPDESGTIGGLLSVALSVDSRRPGVTWPLALWSPDFPPPPKGDRDRLADSGCHTRAT